MPLRHILLSLFLASATFAAPAALQFDLGGKAHDGWIAVAPDAAYDPAIGYGFEPGSPLVALNGEGADSTKDGGVTADRPFHFTARVPAEGNYRVRVTLGDRHAASTTTIKAELRRLMVEKVVLAAGEFKTVTFIVNVRTPAIPERDGIRAGTVRLKAPRETTQEAWAWDRALTLEFGDARPAVCAVEIEPVEVPTIFLLGDSTVCDQSKEPYNSWGQMITRFFSIEVAIANHGESGETYRDSIARRRLDKVVSAMRPGDWLIMQFGHNDQKQVAAKTGGPFTTYKQEIKTHVAAVKACGGEVVIVSPMERRGFDADAKVEPSLIEYADAARQVAEELGVAFIDLNAVSKRLYEALGPERSAAAFAAPHGKIDNTHHNNYGSYQLAQCIVQAIRDQKLPIARYIAADFTGFDPSRPDNPDTFAVPASGEFTNERPLGD